MKIKLELDIEEIENIRRTYQAYANQILHKIDSQVVPQVQQLNKAKGVANEITDSVSDSGK